MPFAPLGTSGAQVDPLTQRASALGSRSIGRAFVQPLRLTIVGAAHSGQDVIAQMLGAHPEAPDALGWAIHTHQEAEALSLVLSDKIIHVSRDGRAVVLAAAAHAGLEPGAPIGAAAARTLAADWARSVHVVRRYASVAPNAHTVMFEHLATSRGQWRTLLSRLGVDADDRTIAGMFTGASSIPSEDWQARFTNDAKAAFKAAAGALLIELGYERDMAW